MRKLIFSLGLLFAVTTWAALSEVDKAQLNSTRLDINGGFENGKAGWVASGGTFLPVSSGSNLLFGLGSATWDSSAASQTLKSKLVAIPEGLKGANGVARCTVKTPSGTATHLIAATDGTNVLATKSIVSSSVRSDNEVNFIFPTSGSVQLQLKSVASDEPLISIDNCEVSKADNIGTVSQASLYGSIEYAAAANCSWTNGAPSSTFAAFAADTDCPTPTVRNYASAPGTKIPGIVFASLPPGRYVFTARLTNDYFGCEGPSGDNACMWRFHDGTNGFGGSYSRVISDIFHGIGGGFVSGEITYSSAQSNVTIQLQSAEAVAGPTSISINNGGTGFNSKFEITVYRFPLESEQVYRPDVLPWRVDANIGGANPSLGLSAITSYTELTHGSLDIVKNTGSLDVQIPCSSTNASSGLTCSAGSESVGVVFNVPKAGSALACFSFTHTAALDSSADGVNAAFQIVETPNNAQTILQEGKSRITAYHYSTFSGVSATHKPIRLCGTFYFSSAGQKTLRLMVEQAVVGTPTESTVGADRDTNAGQRDIHVEVYPIDQQVPAPLLVNSVVSKYSGVARTTWANVNVCNSSGSALNENSGDVSITNGAGTGQCVLNFSPAFAETPTCTCITTPGSNNGWCFTGTSSASSMEFYSRNSSGVATSGGLRVICMGKN